MRWIASSVVLVCFAETLAAQEVRAVRLVQRLKGSSEVTHEQAGDALVALGGQAVKPLLDALPAKDNRKFARRVLRLLGRIRPSGGTAFPDLMAIGKKLDSDNLIDLLRTLGDLAPYRPEGTDADVIARDSFRFLIRSPRPTRAFLGDAWHRLRMRAGFSLRPTLEYLVTALDGYRPYRVELAIEHTARRGAAAHAVVPGLLRILDRPDPRIPSTDQRLPLRENAARAILKIAGAEYVDATARARAVLDGAGPRAPRPIPQRAKERLAQLIRDLASDDPKRIHAASVNLEAYRTLSVPVIAVALPSLRSAESRSAALGVLRRLGQEAAPAYFALTEVLTVYPARHTAEIMELLAEIVPWSRDVSSSLLYTYRLGDLRLLGVRIQGDASPGVFNRVAAAYQKYTAAVTVDPGVTIDDLARLLRHASVCKREVALRLLRLRGRAARPAIRSVLEAMRDSHPSTSEVIWNADGSSSHRMVSRDDAIHRRAAEAVLAIDPENERAVVEARAVLRRLRENPK